MAVMMLCLLLLAVGGVVWSLRDNSNPATLWTWGWAILAGLSGLLLYAEGVSWSLQVAALLSPLFPAFMLAGALSYRDRPAQHWLLPSALGVGCARLILIQIGLPEANHAIAIAGEPAVELLAAWHVYRVNGAFVEKTATKLVAPALVAVAVTDSLTGLALARGGEFPTYLGVSWISVGLVTLALQITASGHRGRQLRSQLQLEGEMARRALVESETRFTALAEHLSDLITEIDETGRMIYLSPSVRQVLGRDPETMLGTRGTRWIHPDDLEQTVREMERVIRDNERSTILFRCRHADGSWRWIEANVGAYRSISGAARIVTISRDVTDRHERQESLRRSHDTLEQRVADRTVQLQQVVEDLEREVAARRSAESELRSSYERYRIVSELSSDYSFGLEILEDGTIRTLWVTDAFPRLTGYTVAEMEELGWATLLDEEFRENARSLLTRALEGTAVELEGRAVTKAGTPWWIHTRFIATRIGSGGGYRVIGSSRDVTDRRRAEEGRRQLEAHMSEVQRLDSLGVLAGGIAHDFNNLLSVILGNTTLAQSDVPEDSELGLRLTRIRSAALHGAGLTEQMLTYSGKTPFTPIPTDLSTVVIETRDLLEASIGRKCKLTFDTAANLPAVDGDETQLRQIVVNLVTNAAEALGEQRGNVHICTRTRKLGLEDVSGAFGSSDARAGEYVAIEVEDNGPGIEQTTQERIFDPFFTTRRSGRGLGLAAVLGIVRGHRGVILLESESGRGTTVRVCLPVSMEPVRAVDPAPQGTTRPVHPNATVLIIDDEEDVLEIGAEFLKRAGFSVLTAQSGREAIATLEANVDVVDVVVLDLVMPDMDGEETLSGLRRIRADLRVIVVSGYDQERTYNRFAPGQVAHFIRKPYEPEELIKKTHAALES